MNSTILNKIQVVYLIHYGGLIYTLLENVTGVLSKMNGCTTSFMDYAVELLTDCSINFTNQVKTKNKNEI